MLEILVITIMLLVSMARRKGSGKRRAMRTYRKLPFRLDSGWGAITDDEVARLAMTDTTNDKFWVSSCKATYAMRDFTVGEGPVNLYIAHSDYTTGEVEEAIEAISSWDQGDLIAREQANRKIRHVGVFALNDQGEEVLNDGRPLTTRLGFLLENGDTLAYHLHATGGAVTSGSLISAMGHVNAWRR